MKFHLLFFSVFIHFGLWSQNDTSSAILKIDDLLTEEKYDSAQNIIDAFYPSGKGVAANFYNYLFTVRQAEIYYYTQLNRLGIYESKRALNMSISLGDSTLISDSYNFIGLFMLSLDSQAVAADYFKKALEYAPQNGQEFFRGFTFTHKFHILNNLAETYLNRSNYAKAELYAEKSRILAEKKGNSRAVAVAYHTLGTTALRTQRLNDAKAAFDSCFKISQKHEHKDVLLLAYAGLSSANINNAPQSLAFMKDGIAHLKSHPSINLTYASDFLNSTITVAKNLQNDSLIMVLQHLKIQTTEQQVKRNYNMLGKTLEENLINERQLLIYQQRDAKAQKTQANIKLVIAIIGIIVLFFLVLLINKNYRQTKKLIRIRESISRDLHDEIGASLSSLQLYSNVAGKLLDVDVARAKTQIQKIENLSKEVMETMNDIVWSMHLNTQTISLSEKIKNYTSSLISNGNLNVAYVFSDDIDEHLTHIEIRKNCILFIKEAVNNACKYSQANKITITLKIVDHNLHISVADDGIGFNPEKVKAGNGLANMQHRMNQVNGKFSINTKLNFGTTISGEVPLKEGVLKNTAF